MKRPGRKFQNIVVALLLGMGFFGWVHFTAAVIIAIYRHRLSELNPYHLINVERAMGHLSHNPLVFAIGWLVFVSITYGFYYLVKLSRH